ncbi:hypothetical protein GCM10022197_08640 [Microlunatus spumicola]|uniref:Uncharacterized protein n=1 Tax=Microlunatus spumicola TaxID=81499 RepID=A0ABP6WWD5_9ACTN
MDEQEVERRIASLLAGPRGRHVCAAVGVQVAPDLGWPFRPTDRADAATFVHGLAAVDPSRVAALQDPSALVDALGTAVDSAAYWQEPAGLDDLLGRPDVVGALRSVARGLVSAPAAAWWWEPLAPEVQSIVRWCEPGRRRAEAPELTGTVERLRRWRHGTVAGEAEAQGWPTSYETGVSGEWWSTPVAVNITTTSLRLGRLPAVQLELVEDAMGWERARVAPVAVLPDRSVYEIGGPSDWTDLVDRYPLEVDRSRRHDWWLATGGRGPWQIPDWYAVSQDHDAVHLTVAGYLAAAGRALPTRGGQTVLAGFDPGLAYWLTDSLGRAESATTWRRVALEDDEHRWVTETD